MSRLRRFVETDSHNAAVVWLLVAGLVVSAVASLALGDVIWALTGAAIAAVALVPTVLARDLSVLVDWRVLALAAAPVALQWSGAVEQSLAYVAVAALALLVAVEVDAFSTAEMPPWFAVLFVVLATMTAAALLGAVQYVADVALGTEYLAGRKDLMWDLVAATVVGVGAGVLFELFFRAAEAGADDVREAVGR